MEIDSAYIRQVRANEAYDYISEINDGKALPAVSDLGPSSIGGSPFDLNVIFNSELFRMISILLLVIIVGLILYKVFTSIKFESDSEDVPYEGALGDDTIYGHDWKKEIDTLMREDNYSEAIVLMYLQWLEWLDSEGVIKFASTKTPGMLLDEAIANAKYKEAIIKKTQTLTNHYLRIRYGHRKATREEVDELLSL